MIDFTEKEKWIHLQENHDNHQLTPHYYNAEQEKYIGNIHLVPWQVEYFEIYQNYAKNLNFSKIFYSESNRKQNRKWVATG